MSLSQQVSHAVIWIDHREAHVIHFDADASENNVIKTSSTHPHLHHKAGPPGAGHTATGQSYLHAVIDAVSTAAEILIVGPGSAKLELFRHASKHDPQIAAKIVALETVDHPSDAQLLAYARKYFVRVDKLKGDPAIHS